MAKLLLQLAHAQRTARVAWSSLATSGMQVFKVRAQAMFTAPMTSNYQKPDLMAIEARRLRLPFVHDIPQRTNDGVAVYGPDFEDIFRRAGHYTARILKGKKPARRAIEEPRSFQLILNLAKAGALGITTPQSVRLRADQVIE
ncbi:MAG: hypothetical protein LH632_05635 [Rhodoferax sp.]|nr:hypothetical protein [Rhodoferax sp.]